MNSLLKFKECQKGITSIEYGLIAVVIAVFVVAVLYGDNGFITALQTKLQLLTSTIVTAVLTK
ncbi:Flp family type IVb pilin [Pasteurella canis]|uniref:Flp family type IVb pilin n=1 Tax=Pasteurella canis TaxID=753 RepID=UPI001CC7FC44|nr:Flp family type IVb pilin [Pasteurella canis]UAY78519.1 Flp family type IVb pilin [Pasteurella canis]